MQAARRAAEEPTASQGNKSKGEGIGKSKAADRSKLPCRALRDGKCAFSHDVRLIESFKGSECRCNTACEYHASDARRDGCMFVKLSPILPPANIAFP